MKSDERKTRRKFTAEYKDQAVKRVLSGHQVSAVAKALGKRWPRKSGQNFPRLKWISAG